MAKKVCRKCKIFVEGPTCQICKGNKFTDNWKGRLYVFDANKSEIGKNITIAVKGEYAIKIK